MKKVAIVLISAALLAAMAKDSKVAIATYDPRTGITSYKAPAPQEGSATPSTATSLAPAATSSNPAAPAAKSSSTSFFQDQLNPYVTGDFRTGLVRSTMDGQPLYLAASGDTSAIGSTVVGFNPNTGKWETIYAKPKDYDALYGPKNAFGALNRDNSAAPGALSLTNPYWGLDFGNNVGDLAAYNFSFDPNGYSYTAPHPGALDPFLASDENPYDPLASASFASPNGYAPIMGATLGDRRTTGMLRDILTTAGPFVLAAMGGAAAANAASASSAVGSGVGMQSGEALAAAPSGITAGDLYATGAQTLANHLLSGKKGLSISDLAPAAVGLAAGAAGVPSYTSGAAAGATSGLMTGGGEDALLEGAAAGGLAKGGAAPIADKLGGGMLGRTGASMLTAGGTGALSGGDPLKAALTAGALTSGSEAAAPIVNNAIDSVKSGMLPVQVADATGETNTPLFSPHSYMNQPGFLNAPSIDEALKNTTSPVYGDVPEGVTIEPGSFQGYDPVTGRAVFTPPATPQPTAPKIEKPTPSPEQRDQQTANELLQIGQALTKIYAGHPAPVDAPQRQAGQSDAQYGQSLVQYAQSNVGGFNADALNGLTPGTPQYYQAVMDQMDSIIERATAGVDLNGKDLESQLRAKGQKEIQALDRALYIRGQLGTLMGSGSYVDPFTGQSQDINTNGMLVNPAVAAYQRGLAGTAEQIAGQDQGTATQSIKNLIARNPDLYNMQANQSVRDLLAAYAAQGYPRKKHNGMLPVEL